MAKPNESGQWPGSYVPLYLEICIPNNSMEIKMSKLPTTTCFPSELICPCLVVGNFSNKLFYNSIFTSILSVVYWVYSFSICYNLFLLWDGVNGPPKIQVYLLKLQAGIFFLSDCLNQLLSTPDSSRCKRPQVQGKRMSGHSKHCWIDDCIFRLLQRTPQVALFVGFHMWSLN